MTDKKTEPPPVVCPNGHGPMAEAPGYWSLRGWDRQQKDPGAPMPNGSYFLLRLWCCERCGLCQFYDPEVRR